MPDLRYERFLDSHYAIFTMDRPDRLNAQGAAMREELRAALDEFAADPEMRVGILTGAGRAFSAGADLKEMTDLYGTLASLTEEQRIEGYRGNQPFGRNPKPFIAAVNGFCVGGGVGLVGNADCIVASDDAYFGVPEVNQGALGAATHMARLVPPHMLRTLYFTARTIKAVDLVQFGSVLETVPREELMDAALRVATDIASKDTRVIRAAKEALNGIDPVDVNKSYRFEQGFTFELNLAGVADELRDEFAGTEKSKK